ncbi:hypothetical protein TRAPUB_7684 [Trametes pubescens]|uniref:CxC2-like cysteine cluster KDZ transposase-associated domain-containing protein n=1 Tax=Trametes pubescens TaxID=154538 RepID=A0A1M2V2N1_TRAPU|nr:hypothetical protein TRAPUB_7684 [Trametes pubescens]
MTKKAKAPRTGFFQPRQPVASSTTLSADGRRQVVTHKVFDFSDTAVADTEPLSSASVEQVWPAFLDEAGVSPAPEPVEGLQGVSVITTTRAKRYTNSDEPLRTWQGLRDEYLSEVLRLDGRGNFRGAATCPRCTTSTPKYRCRDCLGGEVLCQACIVAAHQNLPLHIVEEWLGTYFQRTSLRTLGAVLRPAHIFGAGCIRVCGTVETVVLHTNGVHTVDVQYCECSDAERRVQLLRLGWWPATPLDPRTCATMALLRHFHLLNLQGKLPAYDFYRALELATDNVGLGRLPDRASMFMLMMREWRHITMAKRAGRGHTSSGIGETEPGGLAVLCRACPRPGINLPDDWESAQPGDAWIYQLMISQDANFRLKHRLRQSSRVDCWLGPGMAYFVENDAYAKYIATYAATPEDVRTCSGFAALLNALTRNAKGLRSTGVVAVSCRHELCLPNGLGDLQKGERYRNIDYVVASSIRNRFLKVIKNSFDVACEWNKGFFRRIQDLPPEIQPRVPQQGWTFVVPKFHVAAHKESCQATYSPNWTANAARFDGEHVERIWSRLNSAAPSTKEMGTGARWEALDDFCGFNNWRKTTQLGDDLLRWQIEAIPQAIAHKADFEAFDRNLRQQRPQDVKEWEEMVVNWERSRDGPNPYVLPKTYIQLRYLTAENAAIAGGNVAGHDGSAVGFVVLGLEIRESQFSLSRQRKAATTTLQQVGWHKRAAPVLKKLLRFYELQARYMPGLPASATEAGPTIDNADSRSIVFPSDLDESSRARFCVEGLLKIEEDLREADAYEALEALRHALRLRTSYNTDKVKNVTGQVHNTRAREKQASVDEAVNDEARRYRDARRALLRIRGGGAWEGELRPLLDSDIVGLNERALSREERAENERIREMGQTVQDHSVPLSGVVSVGEGRRTLSWIWYSAATEATFKDDNGDPGLRDGSARRGGDAALYREHALGAKQWNFLRSHRQSQANGRGAGFDAALDEGLAAYADQHCAMETALADAFEAKWRTIRTRALSFISGEEDPTPQPTPGVIEPAVEVVEVEVELDDGDPGDPEGTEQQDF